MRRHDLLGVLGRIAGATVVILVALAFVVAYGVGLTMNAVSAGGRYDPWWWLVAVAIVAAYGLIALRLALRRFGGRDVAVAVIGAVVVLAAIGAIAPRIRL